MKFQIFITAAFVVLFASCASYRDVQVSANVDEAWISGVRGSKFVYNLPVVVYNPTSQNLYLKKSQFDIFRKGYIFAEAELGEKVTIPKKSKATYVVKMNGVVKDVFGASVSRLNFKDENVLKEFTVTGFAMAGIKIFSKKIKFKNATFLQLQQQFEVKK